MSGETQKEANLQASSVPQPLPGDSQPTVPVEHVQVSKRSSNGYAGIAPRHVFMAAVIVLVSAILVAIHLHSFFEDPKFHGVLISAGMHKRLHGMLPHTSVDAAGSIDVPLVPLVGLSVAAAFATWLLGAFILAVVSWSPWRVMLWHWGVRFMWLWLLGLFEALWDTAGAFSGDRLGKWFTVLAAGTPLLYAIAWGGWIAGAFGLLIAPDRSARLRRALAHPSVVWIGAALYAGTWAILSILQYRSLMVPHGDTAMYEEHLWNLLHGKGFRSQLDGGRLFFGEHLEVIHVLLLPLYVLLPSLQTLNVCLTLGLASGAIAVRGITRQLTGSGAAANWLAAAYLLYSPLQYLNLEVSLKTFRPENFGVPLLLFAIWALEVKRFRTMLLLLALTLLCKEDYAIPVGMLGLFLMCRGDSKGGNRNTRWLGAAVFAFSFLFLGFVLTVFIPAFRDGPPHYMAYYPDLGATPLAIAKNLTQHPGLLINSFATEGSIVYILTLLVPLALLPLFGFGRLSLCLPTLVSILLIQLDDARSPFFHFHAPLVPMLFWAAAEGLSRLGNVHAWWLGGRARDSNDDAHGQPVSPRLSVTGLARFAAGCALVSGFFIGKSPLSLAFYDPDAGLRGFWQVLYCPSGMITLRLRNFERLYPTMTELTEEYAAHLQSIGRSRSFERLFPLIPRDAVVAATDFIRPRFTHHRACHQYGEGGLKPHVNAAQIDYIVIDLIGPYSDWVAGQRLRELEEHPDRWEVMHWDPEGEVFFHVLRAKRSDRP